MMFTQGRLTPSSAPAPSRPALGRPIDGFGTRGMWVGLLVVVLTVAACADNGMEPPLTIPISSMARSGHDLCEEFGGVWTEWLDVPCVIAIDGIVVEVEDQNEFTCGEYFEYNGSFCEPNYPGYYNPPPSDGSGGGSESGSESGSGSASESPPINDVSDAQAPIPDCPNPDPGRQAWCEGEAVDEFVADVLEAKADLIFASCPFLADDWQRVKGNARLFDDTGFEIGGSVGVDWIVLSEQWYNGPYGVELILAHELLHAEGYNHPPGQAQSTAAWDEWLDRGRGNACRGERLTACSFRFAGPRTRGLCHWDTRFDRGFKLGRPTRRLRGCGAGRDK